MGEWRATHRGIQISLKGFIVGGSKLVSMPPVKTKAALDVMENEL